MMDPQPTQPSPSDSGAGEKRPRGLRSRRLPLSNAQIILLALLMVGGRLIIDFSQRIVEGQQKLAEERQLEAEIEALLEEQQALEEAKSYYSSPAFVEDWAHDQGKMVREGETLVIPLYEWPEEQLAVTPAPPEESPPLPSWLIWWTLFFDNPPSFGMLHAP
ncbi:MAG TPA: hypothetical protein ENI95_01475 [Chloroflexi bacterium]|nr:hypothetical protein [Chloroflexota bacterium]